MYRGRRVPVPPHGEADHGFLLVWRSPRPNRPDDLCGENLYEITGGLASPQQVVDAWADEARDYGIRTSTCTAVCRHYTQIVSRSTRAVGCGVAGGDDREIWVCEYDPPGNMVGYRSY